MTSVGAGKVSMVMAVCDCELWVEAAVRSALDQGPLVLEVLVVDDASTDGTLAILEGIRDERVRLVRRTINTGQTPCLNAGLALARGEYVARLDGDDLALPSRVAAQVRFLSRHPHIALVGTALEYVDQDGKHIKTVFNPSTPASLRWELLFENAFGHSTLMWRKSAVDSLGGYDENFAYANDYDLVARLAASWDTANLSFVGTAYRVHPQAKSVVGRGHQRGAAGDISLREMRKLMPDTPEQVLRDIRAVRNPVGAERKPAIVASPCAVLAALRALRLEYERREQAHGGLSDRDRVWVEMVCRGTAHRLLAGCLSPSGFCELARAPALAAWILRLDIDRIVRHCGTWREAS